MTLTNVTEASLFTALFVFLLLCGTSLLLMLPKRRKGRRWSEMVTNPRQFLAIRLGLALGAGCLMFVLITAALTLNRHRPPDGPTPLISVTGSAGRTAVNVDLGQCGDDADGTIAISGVGPGSVAATIQTGDGASRPIKLGRNGTGKFTLSDPGENRGVLSCFLEMPVVRGDSGSSVTLGLGSGMEVDTLESVPSPAGYADGRWTWNCPAGETCGVLATVRLAIEEGAKQVIVLVLASVFGAIIALFIGEALIAPVRRRLGRWKTD